MSDLKPCPFCDGQAKIKRCGSGYFRVVCDQCKIGTSHCATIESAVEKWNKRSTVAKNATVQH
jgi:hypothetical protein